MSRDASLRSRNRHKPIASLRSRKATRGKRSTKKEKGCIKIFEEKYVNRNSPSYPANECGGVVKKGNDKRYWYISRADKNGIYRWQKYSPIFRKV